MTKGQLIKELKANGIRATKEGKKLEHSKYFELVNLYYDSVKKFMI
jgi:hypothetical protein